MPWPRSLFRLRIPDIDLPTPQLNIVRHTSSGSLQDPYTIPLAIQLEDRPSLLTCAIIHNTDHATNIWSGIRDVVANSGRRHRLYRLHSRWYQLLSKPMVGTSRVDQTMHCCSHPSEESPCYQVSLGPFKHSVVLTEAYRNAHTCRQAATPFLGYHVWTEKAYDEVVTIRYQLDRCKVAWLLMLLLILSPGLGLTVGWASHRADVGVGVSAAVFALASFLQGWFGWLEG